MKTLLMIEDDPILGEGLKLNLELEGYNTIWAKNLREGEDALITNKIDITLLDINLPDGSGLDFLKNLRSKNIETPVIILSAQSEEEIVIKGLNLGANDYVKKPFRSGELFARIKSTLRISSGKSQSDEMLGDLVISIDERTIFSNGKQIPLNRREFDLLIYMIKRINYVLTREMIIRDLGYTEEVMDRTIDSHISHLRSKLKKANVTSIKVKSEYGIGYRLIKND